MTRESHTDQPRCPICAAELAPPQIESPDRLHGTGGQHRVAVCPRCTAGVTLPRVDDGELAAFYPDEYGPYDERMSSVERLISRSIRAFQGWNAFRSAPLAALADRRVGRGLDVGCGRGDLAAAFVARGWAMSGIEPSGSACAVASRRGIDVQCGTLSTVALEPGRYDAVVFHHSLEHTNDPVGALASVAAALAPGGLVLITVPNFASWQARRFAGSWYHLDVPRHRVHFTATSLEWAVRTAGLEVLSMSNSSSPVGLPASLQYRAFGRCLFPSGFGLRAALGLCALSLPVSIVLDRAAGAGDTLHAVTRGPS